MAGKRQRANGSWEFVFKKAGLLEKPLYLTFDTEAEGDKYAERLEAQLAAGIVPAEVQTPALVLTIAHLVAEYLRDAHPSAKDIDALNSMLKTRGQHALTAINVAWVDAWISEMKRIDRVKPTTIVGKVGALARCTDWGTRKGWLVMPDNPLRTLPEGYAQYTELDALLAGGKQEDGERDRRLEKGEAERVAATLAAGVLPRKQRPRELEDPVALQVLFTLAVESAMRLRELYTLDVDQVDLARKTVFLDKTKNGDKRQVPLSTVAIATLTIYMQGLKGERLFPWWDGDTSQKNLVRTSNWLSTLWIEIFKTAECPGLLFHDLRHEAVCRLFERTKLSDAQIMRITGHKSIRMLLRYANLRGSDLAAALW